MGMEKDADVGVMNQDGPKLGTAGGLLKQVLRTVDVFVLALSPMAILGFVIATIIMLDGFGTHVNFVRALQQDGQLGSGTLYYDGPADTTAVVELDEPDGEMLILYTRYYSPATLNSLAEGQTVRVRYTAPPEHEYKAVLEDHFDEVRAYWGYLKEVIWVLAVCWFMLVLHPELLYLGFSAAFDEAVKK